LLDIIVIAICAVIFGADCWVDVELFGQSKPARLESFLELPNGIPPHAAFGRVFGLSDPAEFQTGGCAWQRIILNAQAVLEGKSDEMSHQSLARSGIQAMCQG
jgi:hypothetical protein